MPNLKFKAWIESNMHTSLLRSRSWALLSHFILAPFAQQIFIFKMTCKNICAVFEQKGRLKMIEISGYWPWKRCWRFIRTHHAELTSVLEICKSKFNGYGIVFLKTFSRDAFEMLAKLTHVRIYKGENTKKIILWSLIQLLPHQSN